MSRAGRKLLRMRIRQAAKAGVLAVEVGFAEQAESTPAALSKQPACSLLSDGRGGVCHTAPAKEGTKG
jgi:hypothetical protein